MENALLHDGLEFWRREAPTKIALVLDGNEFLSYGELGQWSDGVAAMLQAKGVAPGDTIFIAGLNSIEWVVAAFGILKAGAAIVPVNERFVRDEVAYLLETVEPQAIIADGPRANIARAAGAKAPLIAMESIADFRDGAPAGWKSPRVPSDSLAEIIFTSGTTGRPKGVMMSHSRLLSRYLEIRLVDQNFGGTDLKQLMPVSLQSGVGTGWGYLFTTTNGGTLYFMRHFDPAMALRIIVDHQLTFIAAFPQLWEQMSRQPGFADADLSSIKIATVGGARISPDLFATCRQKGVLLRNMYGLTEGGFYVIVASEEEARTGKQTTGRPMIYTQVKIIRPDGGECDTNEPGQILVKGSGTMIGYWKNPEATTQTVVDGWVHTGDLGMFNDEGYLTYIDRTKDMIKTGGFNVSPSEVENVISQLPEVLEVVVFAVPDEKFGEAPAACIYASPKIAEEAIFAHCKERLAGFKLPRYIVMFDEPLPRMSSSKIAKLQLRTEYADAPSRFQKYL